MYNGEVYDERVKILKVFVNQNATNCKYRDLRLIFFTISITTRSLQKNIFELYFHPLIGLTLFCYIQPDYLRQRGRRRVDRLDGGVGRQGPGRRNSGRVVRGHAALQVDAQQADGQAEQEEVREDRQVLSGRVPSSLSHFQRDLLVQLLHEINKRRHFKILIQEGEASTGRVKMAQI